MLKPRTNLNLLAVLEAVYVRSSVTQAARQLNLSQSAISHALGRLRREFDDPLFVREGNTMVPTALTRSIVDPVQRAFRDIEVAIATASRFDPAATTRLFRIGLRPTTEVQLFPVVVLSAVKQAPHVRIVSMDFRRTELATSLATGVLDVAIDVPSHRTAGLHAMPLRTDDLVVAARHGHPDIRGSLDLETYLALDHVMASPRPAALGSEDEALATIGRERRIPIRCQHIAAAWRIVEQSDVILTVARSYAGAAERANMLQLLPLPFPVTRRPLQLVWHEAFERDPGHAWLRKVISYEVMNLDHDGNVE